MRCSLSSIFTDYRPELPRLSGSNHGAAGVDGSKSSTVAMLAYKYLNMYIVEEA